MARTIVSAAAAGHSSFLPVDVTSQSPVRVRSELSDSGVAARLDRSDVFLENYGTMDSSKRRKSSGSQRRMDDDISTESSDTSDEEEELTPESYTRIIMLYSFVPITSFITILVFILLKLFVWPLRNESPTRGTNLILVFLGAAIWTVSFSLRLPLYHISKYICRAFPTSIPFLSTFLQVFSEETLRLSSIIIAQIHVQEHVNVRDPSFSHIWVLALGWATTEVTVSIVQGYKQLALYNDVMFLGAAQDDHLVRTLSMEEQTAPPVLGRPGYQLSRTDSNFTLDKLLRARARVELEALYGVPVPQIPVFVSSLLRIDSVLLSFALFLIISSFYFTYICTLPFAAKDPIEAIQRTLPVLIGIITLHTLLAFAWTPDILPRIGLHAASYISCIVALGAFFVGLAMWEAI